MAFPFAGFGSFAFLRDEKAIMGSDSYWLRSPSFARSRPLGSATDTLVLLAVGSGERSFEVLLSVARFTTFEALQGSTATFTDWDRPDPDSRSATLVRVEHRERVLATCSDGITRQRVRAAVTLVSQ